MKRSIKQALSFLALSFFAANLASAGVATGSLHVSLTLIPASQLSQDQSIYVHTANPADLDTALYPVILADDAV